jgi:hypothetical protein
MQRSSSNHEESEYSENFIANLQRSNISFELESIKLKKNSKEESKSSN